MRFAMRSESFADGQPMPARFTGEGANQIPTLSWDGVPPGTQELALICDDPDAPSRRPFVHWIAYRISSDTMNLPEAMSRNREVETPRPIVEGRNSFGNLGYDGPLPPEGDPPHRYVFRLYALDRKLDLRPGATREELLTAMSGHVLGTAQLTGTYRRAGRRAG